MIEEKMLFAEHLSLMIKGGITISEALNILKKEARSRTFKRALSDISKRILEGENLHQAMSYHPKIFDRFYQNLVRIGEESGTLEENLKYLSLKLQKDNEMKRKVRGAMIYPLIIIGLALFIAFGAAFFVLPQVTNLFKSLSIELPLFTKILISFVAFFKKYWLAIIFAILVAIFLFKILLKIKSLKFILDKISLSLPVLGRVLKNLNLSFFARTFHILLKSGMPLAEALEILSETLPNEVYRRNLISLRAQIERGEKISSGLKTFPKSFPLIFSEMVLVGEKSGSLEESLWYLAEFHEKEVDTALRNLTTILEPALLILVGIFVAFLYLAIIIPIYRFTGQLRLR